MGRGAGGFACGLGLEAGQEPLPEIQPGVASSTSARKSAGKSSASLPVISVAVARDSRCPSGSAAASTCGHMWRTITSARRPRRSAPHPAPAAKTWATWPPASSNATVWLSKAGTSPMSWNSAAT